MTTIPQPAAPTAAYGLTYDAWNRLTVVSLGVDAIATYQYDGLGQRIAKEDVIAGSNYDYYYNDRWQLLTETIGSTVEAIYQWHPHYIDALCLRMRASDMHWFTAGSGLAEAMREQPSVYDSLCVQMVEVGENSGTLDVVLEQVASFSERAVQFKDRVTSALLYPAIVLMMSVGVGMFLMTVVVPMLLDNLLDAGRPLPWPTRVLKSMSDTVCVHGWWIALLIASAAIGLVPILRTERGRLLWHRLLLRIPLLGGMAQKQEIARIAMIIATLMKSGIVFLQALETAARTTKNIVISRALLSGRDTVMAGRDIGDALAPTGVFPPMVIQIFAVGQQSGRLEEMLDRLSQAYERQVNSLATRLAAVLEPVLIIFLSVFVGFILFATILPILEAGNVL